MAENYLASSIGFPRSLQHLARGAARKGSLYEFLKDWSSVDRVYQKWDFTENYQMTNYPFYVANSGGTSAANFEVSDNQENGTIGGATGSTDNGSLSLIGWKMFYGDRNAGCLFRWRVNDASSYNIEFGFIDAVPASNGSGTLDIDTPSTTAADCALFTIDTDQTLNGLHFITNGSTAGQDPVKTSVPVPSISNDTYYIGVIQLLENKAYALFGRNTADSPVQLVASHDKDADGAVEGGVALAPWFYARTRTGTSRTPRIDLIEVWHDRA